MQGIKKRVLFCFWLLVLPTLLSANSFSGLASAVFQILTMLIMLIVLIVLSIVSSKISGWESVSHFTRMAYRVIAMIVSGLFVTGFPLLEWLITKKSGSGDFKFSFILWLPLLAAGMICFYYAFSIS